MYKEAVERITDVKDKATIGSFLDEVAGGTDSTDLEEEDFEDIVEELEDIEGTDEDVEIYNQYDDFQKEIAKKGIKVWHLEVAVIVNEYMSDITDYVSMGEEEEEFLLEKHISNREYERLE